MTKTTITEKSVWIVDDDPIARLLIKKAIDRTGLFDCYKEFSDGSEFIEELAKKEGHAFDEPALILLDINMPEKNGWDVLDFIKQKGISFRKSQLVLLTSSINPKDKSKAFTYDTVKDFLNKPLAKEDLERLEL